MELILAAEESFGIEISDEEAGRVETAGDLCELVRRKVTKRQQRVCLTSALFYRVRRGLTAVLGVERRSIRPGSVLEELLPREVRAEKWCELERHSHLRLPSLLLPAPGAILVLAGGPVVCGTAALVVGMSEGMIALALAFGLLPSAVVLRIMQTHAVQLPAGVVTVGDLARGALARNYAALARDAGGFQPEEIWDAVKMLIHVQTGTPLERITPGAGLLNDLGID